jgi:hypothetical protein
MYRHLGHFEGIVVDVPQLYAPPTDARMLARGHPLTAHERGAVRTPLRVEDQHRDVE